MSPGIMLFNLPSRTYSAAQLLLANELYYRRILRPIDATMTAQITVFDAKVPYTMFHMDKIQILRYRNLYFETTMTSPPRS